MTRPRRFRSPCSPAFLLALLAGVAASWGCQAINEAKIARRVFDDHRARAKVKPLPRAGIIRITLTRTDDPAASGTEVLEWDEGHFRETVSSAGWTRVRGIQGEKAFFTDEDGVTRVASEPLLADLITRSYFWRRAYLFDDLERARTVLGPSDAASVTIGLTPRGGDLLWLTFGRSDGRLLRAQSTRFDLAFETPARFLESSGRATRVGGEIAHVGLPIRSLADTNVGGWSSEWKASIAESPLVRKSDGVAISVRISGHPASLRFDGAEDGPLRLSPGLADELRLRFAPDIFGRFVSRGAELAVGPLSFPSVWVERTRGLPDGVDAAGGAPFFRETVVEVDSAEGRVRFHDPAQWVNPEGFFRVLIDDDGNRPVVIGHRNGVNIRLLGPTSAAAPILLTPEAARRLGLSGRAPVLQGLWIGPELPPTPVLIEEERQSDYGEDGRLSWSLILQSHADFDMVHRWLYLRPNGGKWGSVERSTRLEGPSFASLPSPGPRVR
ncbi:MAG TPA: hypothetical protein VF376_13760 [Thermoanaerobaculia bacterium]